MKNRQHYESLECARDDYLFQHIKKPTRLQIGQEPSTLGLALTNEDNMINNITYLPSLGKRDYLILSFKFLCHSQQQEVAFKKLNYIRGSYEKMLKRLDIGSTETYLGRIRDILAD